MKREWEGKSTVDEIRARFENDVERFSDLAGGQKSIEDAPLLMELIVRAAVRVTKPIRRVLDIGCGAGNNTLKLLELASGADCTLLDLAPAMLARAKARVGAATTGRVTVLAGDFREVSLPAGEFDVVLAAAVLHHLRDDADWEAAFRKLYRITAPGGSVWITDLVSQEHPAIRALMDSQLGDYLVAAGGEAFRDGCFRKIAVEDSPRPVTFQLDLLRKVGFRDVDLLRKNSAFAAFGDVEPAALTAPDILGLLHCKRCVLYHGIPSSCPVTSSIVLFGCGLRIRSASAVICALAEATAVSLFSIVGSSLCPSMFLPRKIAIAGDFFARLNCMRLRDTLPSCAYIL